jgi:hypothetical protein
MSGLVDQTQDPTELILAGIKAGTIKPAEGLRMLTQGQQAKDRLTFQKSKPQGVGTANAQANRMNDESSEQALANNLAEVPTVLQNTFKGQAEDYIAALHARKGELGMNGKDLQRLYEYIRKQY